MMSATPMNTKHQRIIATMLLLFLLFPFTNLGGKKANLQQKLNATLSKFAKDNKLEEEQLARMLGEIAIGGKAMRKGGVGLVDASETFIVLDEKRNALLLAGKEWQGQDSAESEVVLMGRNQVYGSLRLSDTSNLTIVIFSPREARYIDLSSNLGVKYNRFIQPQSPDN
jgi:hypothetical protein